MSVRSCATEHRKMLLPSRPSSFPSFSPSPSSLLLLLLFSLLLLLWGHGNAAVLGPHQPAHGPYPNLPDARPPQDQQGQEQPPNHDLRQPLVHQQQQQAPRGQQQPREQYPDSVRSEQGGLPHRDGPGSKVDSPAALSGRSRDQQHQPQPPPPPETGDRGRPGLHLSDEQHQQQQQPQQPIGNNDNGMMGQPGSDREVLELSYRQQVERRRQQQDAVRRQQNAIHRQQVQIYQQMDMDRDQRHQLMPQIEPQRSGQSAGGGSNNNNNTNNNINNNNNIVNSKVAASHRGGAGSNPGESDLQADAQKSPAAANQQRDRRSQVVTASSRDFLQRLGAGGGGVALHNNNNNEGGDGGAHARDTDNTNDDEVPDAPHGQVGTTNNSDNHNSAMLNGMSDQFRRGLIRKVYNEEDSNLNSNNLNSNNLPVQRNAFPPEQPLRSLGGMNVAWDWDDFSLTFQNYGAAEMKVRRAPHATTGEPWPLPQYYTKKDKNIMILDPKFEFVISNNFTCDIVEQAVERYRRRLLEQSLEDMYDNLQNAEGTGLEMPGDKYFSNLYRSAPRLYRFSLKIRRPCAGSYPSLESDESYDLVVKKSSSYLWANEVWGLLRGLETLTHLVWKGYSPDNKLYVKESVISDYPRFPHRGILLDSSRHFIFKEVILDMMDAMEMNKMNVLHWHMVDDQSFPYQSQVFPELSAKGAYHPTFVYTHSDIAEIIDYGRLRGIRILPEFDSPGHTYSWGLSRPELLTQCYSGSSPVKGYMGPIDPVRNSTYRFLKTLFGEVLHVFKDQYMHLGGDEVPLGCWQSNPEVVKFGKTLNNQGPASLDNDQQTFFGEVSPSIRMVYEHYVNRVMKDIKDLGKKRNGIKFIMWQEVMNNDLKLPNDTLIQVWIGDMADVSKAIGLGYDVLYSSCWYLDHVEYGVKWPKYYQCDPADASYGYHIDEKKVKGGEACLWSEYIDNENLIQTTWPRASAVAERLWSSKDTRNLDTAGERLSEHRCRMLNRGLSIGQVSGPDYCLRSGVNKGRLRGSKAKCQGAGCKGVGGSPDADAASDPLETHSDIKFRVRTEGGGSTDCSWMGSNFTFLLLLILLAFLLVLTLSRSSGKLALRTCRHRSILLVFLLVLLVYFMCYTTMWMHVFEFSGSFQRKRQQHTAS